VVVKVGVANFFFGQSLESSIPFYSTSNGCNHVSDEIVIGRTARQSES